MNMVLSSRLSPVLKHTSRLMLAVALLAIALAVGAFSFAPAAPATIAASQPSGTTENVGQAVGNAATVRGEIVTLPADQCSALRRATPAASCQARSYSTLTVSPALQTAPLAAKMPATWYNWSYSRFECSIISCKVWGFHLQADGVTNHSQIWQHHVYCNASGLGNCTWHGYFYNGTGSIQVGLDGNACASFCEAHGMRQFINANVTLGKYYQW